MSYRRAIVGTSVAKYYRWPGSFDCRMAYVLGLQRLGYEVLLVDDLGTRELFDADHTARQFADWEGRPRFRDITLRYGLWPSCCLIHGPARETFGVPYDQVLAFAATADFLLNVNGKLRDPEILERVGCRVYVDEAPGHTQVYHSEYGIDQGLSGHDLFFTFGLNIGTAHSEIPACGVVWRPLPPPVVLEMWPARPHGGNGRFTTISNWAGEATFALNGRFSGEKSDSWLKFIEIPQRTSQELEIALNIEAGFSDDIKALHENGWTLADPSHIRTLQDYQQYIGDSRAEFSVGNNRYVEFTTGWFSDRSARYLASGRPVLVQSTGIEEHLPTGEGLLTFADLDGAVAGVEEINRDYASHCIAARRIAEEYFDSERVLGRMVAEVGAQ